MNTSMTKRMMLMLAGCLVVFGSVFGMKWFGNKKMNEFIDAMPIPPVTISAAAVEQQRWDNALEAVGSFVPVNGADLTVEVGGVVTDIHFESGAQVSKGTRLLTLDAAAEQAELTRLKAQAELAELNRARREKLWKLESISKSDYDAAVSEANAAKAAVAAQAAILAKKVISAPFSGVLGIRRANVGEYLQPGSKVVTLQSLDPIDIDFSLPEQYSAVLQPGLKVKVRLDAYPDRGFEGDVLAVEPRVDASTRNFGLRARLSNPDGLLRAGQFGRVSLQLPGERTVLAIPRTAVEYSSYGTSVFVVQPRKPAEGAAPATPPAADQPAADQNAATLEVVQRFVRIGEGRGDFVAVLDGLKAGEQIATSGLVKLRNQQPVHINNELAPKVSLDPKPPQT